MSYQYGMALKTTREQLEEVQTAISAIVSGMQSYGLGDRRVERADLAVLQAREKDLLRRLAQESGDRPVATGVSFTGMGYS